MALGAQALEDAPARGKAALPILNVCEVAMGWTAKQIAEEIGATVEGNPGQHVSGVASPERAGTGDLIFIESERQLERAARSLASTVLLPLRLQLAGKTLLRAEKPKLGFARAAALLLAPVPPAGGIHPSAVIARSARLGQRVAVGPFAVIEEEVEIGAGSEIGPFCCLGRGARLGEDCRLYPRVTLYPGARLGNRVTVHAGAVIGSDGFGYVWGEGRQWKFPQTGGVEIGDEVEIGSNTTIDRGSLETTEIEPDVKIDNLVQVAHNVRIGAHTVVAAQTGISGSVVIGRRVMIGGQVGIADHCKVEDDAILGAQAGVPTGKTIRAGQIVWGTPSRPLERFKQQYGWFARLPALAERVRRLEQGKTKE
jgi:UDP-3-O-[3-hydroxymyristoyl] glucosamine N-acyltransferase